MLIHAANDYDTAPGTAVDRELERLHKPHVLKIYPALGKSSDDGHNLLYLAIPRLGERCVPVSRCEHQALTALQLSGSRFGNLRAFFR